MQPTLFLSDLHLAPSRPGATAAFHAFCAGPARAARAVYILGDLLDWWAGDDQLRQPFFAAIARSLRGVSDAGVPLFIARGNRDFLLGAKFTQATGATLLPDETLIDLPGGATLVSHGDEWCTDDSEYQRFRAMVRKPDVQRRFLRLPYGVRKFVASWLRRKSRGEKARKPEAIMDVNANAIEHAFRAHNVSRMIHGHTHRPHHHELLVDGRRCQRWVLADWHDDGRYLEVDANREQVRTISG